MEVEFPSKKKIRIRMTTASFPASSPWVTSVGGVSYVLDGRKGHSKPKMSAWKNSGGGFSKFFSRPGYQKSSVEDYFKQSDAIYKSAQSDESEFTSLYNHRGRGYPDLAG